MTRNVPILVIVNKNDSQVINDISHLDISWLIYPPVLEGVLRLSIRTALQQKEEKHKSESTHDIQTVQSVLISGLASLSEYRDAETGEHINRTQNYVKALAVTLKRKGYFKDELTEENIEAMYMSVPLHDIGKVGIRDDILLKPAKLTSEEFEIMKTHTTLGYEAIIHVGNRFKNSEFLNYAAEVAYTHHEKYDGTGYPRGLKGEAIPLIGRLMAVADVYDALVSKRVYKETLTHEDAVDMIKSGRGTHFDPIIVDCAVELEKTFQNITHTYMDTEEAVDGYSQYESLKLEGMLNHVLIVEDSKIVRFVMKNQLAALGIDVDIAVDGEEGFEMLLTNTYDLVLLDIELPK